MTDPIAQIAEGAEPTWEETFTHPVHGDLTFRVTRKLTNTDWLRHTATRDAIINRIAPRDEDGRPEFSVHDVGDTTVIFAGACAGITTILDPVVIAEERVTDDVPGHEKIKRVNYDPLQDTDMGFPIQVWNSFFAWRMSLLGSVGELKKGSATTGGGEPGEPSHDPTGSPQTTLESETGLTPTSFESLPTGA